MLIRSQDKKKITTDLNLEIYKPPHRDEYKINAGNVGYIGTYSTEEKAIKVLDMITIAYGAKRISDCMIDANKKIFDHLREDELRELAAMSRNTSVF